MTVRNIVQRATYICLSYCPGQIDYNMRRAESDLVKLGQLTNDVWDSDTESCSSRATRGYHEYSESQCMKKGRAMNMVAAISNRCFSRKIQDKASKHTKFHPSTSFLAVKAHREAHESMR